MHSVNIGPKSSRINLKIKNTEFSDIEEDSANSSARLNELDNPVLTRLGTIKEEFKRARMTQNKNNSVGTRLVNLPNLDDSNDIVELKKKASTQPKDFTRERSNSMFASFQNLISKDEDNIKLLLPIEKDQDFNLPIAEAVLEIQLEYMDKIQQKDFKKFMRRKSCCCSY